MAARRVAQEHHHSFKLPPSDGDTVEGVCKCGERRTFITAFDDDRARKAGARKGGWNEMTGRRSAEAAASERRLRQENADAERYATADSDSVRRIN